MPKRPIDDELPRRRTGKGGIALAPGLLRRAIMYSPKDFVAGTVAFAAICTIVGNAIFMQSGRHPSPMFGTPSFSEVSAPMVANPLPRPRPIEATPPADKPLDSRLFDAKPSETKARPAPEPRVEMRAEPKADPRLEKVESRSADPMGHLIRNASVSRPAAAAPQAAANPNIPRPPASVPTRGDPLADLISGRGGR